MNYVEWSFKSTKEKQTYWLICLILGGVSLATTLGLLFYNNPVSIDSPSYLPVIWRRVTLIIVLIISSLCHSFTTISFQTVVNNRILTPSMLGFDSLYGFIQTTFLYFGGLTTFYQSRHWLSFLLQLILMVSLSYLLYGNLFLRFNLDISRILLLGVILSAIFQNSAQLMRRLMSPSVYDILQARLIGSVNNFNLDTLPIILVVLVASLYYLLKHAYLLDAYALGKPIAENLGIGSQRLISTTLITTAALMSIATLMMGRLTFLGFLVASLTRQLTATTSHRLNYLCASLLCYALLSTAYFIMQHILYVQGAVSLIIEFVGGIAFIISLLRKGLS